MELYYSAARPGNEIVIALQTLQVAYSLRNIDEPDVHQRLSALTATTEVPTLVFDDGSYLINPTPQQFSEKMQMLLYGKAQTQPSTAAPQKWLWIALALLAGFLAFGLGFSVGGTVPPRTVSLLSIALVAGIFVLLVASFVPPVKRLTARLDKQRLFRIVVWIGVFLYLTVMGVAMSVQHKQISVWLWMGIAGFCTCLAITAAAFTRQRWAKGYSRLQKAQAGLAIAGLLGFVGLVVITALPAQAAILPVLLIFQLALFVPMFCIGALFLVGPKPGSQQVGQVAGVLFPMLGILVVFVLLRL